MYQWLALRLVSAFLVRSGRPACSHVLRQRFAFDGEPAEFFDALVEFHQCDVFLHRERRVRSLFGLDGGGPIPDYRFQRHCLGSRRERQLHGHADAHREPSVHDPVGCHGNAWKFGDRLPSFHHALRKFVCLADTDV